jgi:dUTP pyrophosphatase
MYTGFDFVKSHRKTAKLPQRADIGSAGYDFFIPEDVILPPGKPVLVFTDVKAYMPPNVVLLITIRSSLAKRGIILANAPGVVDSSYVDNPANEGNIGLLLLNTGQGYETLEAESRVAQGIFVNYLTTTDDLVMSEKRTGGFGSSGKK